ncbi:ornithine carbamoyltransferase [Lacunimicrobium album]
MKHLTSLLDWTPDEVKALLDLSRKLKQDAAAGIRQPLLDGYVLVQIFEKPSLRTRVSFEAAMIQLGGSGIFMTEKEAGLHGRESLADVARVVTRMADIITLRTFSQKMIEEFAQHASCPVINALSDDRHPCQALADILTMQELFGDVTGRTMVYVGDGNNVAISLATICAMTGVNFVISHPDGYAMPEKVIPDLLKRYPDAKLSVEKDPKKAVQNADAIYTDVWASMGQEEQSDTRSKVFQPYQINESLLKNAPSHAKFLHCLPAKRDQEVTDGVMEGHADSVFLQAENRMHLAKGLFAYLLKKA